METNDSHHKSNKYCTARALSSKLPARVNITTASSCQKNTGRQNIEGAGKAIESMMNEATTRVSSRKMALKIMCSMLLLLLHLNICIVPASGAMNLPDGIENVLGFVPRSTFQCERDGYFGDIDNDCRIFHLCQKQVHVGGRIEWRHWTYACGNQTMFNQLTLTCAFVDEAIPCKHASQFQYLNEVIHKPREPFLTDADVTSGVSYYSNRIMSDGARARAFEDSQLMAQLGGSQVAAQVAPSISPFQTNSVEERTESEEESQQTGVNSIQLNSNDLSSTLPVQHSAAISFQNQQQVQRQNQNQNQNQQQLQANFQREQQNLNQFRFLDAPQVVTFGSELETRAPESFGFSISTNHQPQQADQQQFVNSFHQLAVASLPSTPFPFQVPTTQQQQQQQQQQQIQPRRDQQQLFAPITTTAASLPITGFPQLIPASQATTTTTSASTPVATVATATTTTTIATTSGNRQTGLNEQTTTPSTSASASPVTSKQVVATSTPPTNQLRRRQLAPSTASPDRSGRSTRPASGTASFPRSNGFAGFHSTRISSITSQPAIRREPEPALVMRRQQQQPVTSSVPEVATPSSRPTSQGETAGIAAIDFWRRPFDAQFLTAPRFESLLTRRRV